MAEVLLPSLQTSHISPALGMLQSTSDPYRSTMSAAGNNAPSRQANAHRGYRTPSNTTYRGLQAAPIAPYSFQPSPHMRQPSYNTGLTSQSYAYRFAYPASASSNSTVSSGSSSNPSFRGNPTAVGGVLSKEDQARLQRHQLGQYSIGASSSTPDLLQQPRQWDDINRPSPDRYRRIQRRTMSTGSVATFEQAEKQAAMLTHAGPANLASFGNSQAGANRPPHSRIASADDMMMSRSPNPDRYRRRSVGVLDATAFTPAPSSTNAPQMGPTSFAQRQSNALSGAQDPRPFVHQRSGSSASVSSNGSVQRPGSAQHKPSASMTSGNSPVRPSTQGNPSRSANSNTNTAESNAPSTAASSKRLTTPSPLSRPMNTESDPAGQPVRPPTRDSLREPVASPAMQQLSALSERDANKGVRSRLRRAFSFGSSQELKKATGEATTPADRARMRTEDQDENASISAEEAAVAAKQEAAGLGAGIYSGQGNVFGSTDNLSISSTASSASIMLRKMGRGVKRSTKNLRGLFRPKSVVGVAPADGPVGGASQTTAEISRVTIEADRELPVLSLNTDMSEIRLDEPINRPDTAQTVNTPDLANPSGQDGKGSWGRRSIVASDSDRADVLAAVRKGILKRSATDPTLLLSSNMNQLSFNPQSGSNSGSAPGTPDDSSINRFQQQQGGYFLAANRQLSGSTRSLPPSTVNRNISFSPRIQLHDVWSATEYDRRGDIATCNRLTPILAQQIKEELNSFKMEMEVHELSKPHTHFF